MTQPTIVYTDGACSGNPGPGAWAWVVPNGQSASGFEPHTTNQRMELSAVIEAARSLDGPLDVVSDSTYVVNCFRDRWWEGWLARDWKNSQKKPVANRDLWEPLIEIYRHRDLTFRWVKGHSGDRWNDEADRLAVEAIANRTGQHNGTLKTPPIDDANLDATVNASAGPIVGHILAVTGHRPLELGGYEATNHHAAVREHLGRIIEAKAVLHDDLAVLSALGLGAEMLGAEASIEVGVPFHAVLAHPGQEERWPAESQQRFQRLTTNAASVTTLDRRAPSSKQAASASYARRDAWVRRAADEAVIVWDGREPFVGRTVRAFNDELNEENVWILDPSALT